jgi:MFS family permease
VARILNGMCNANVSTAHAYVADRVPARERAKYMGYMGSAIGLGFVFGPAIGGLLATPGSPERPFLVAAGLAAVNWLMALRFLPESRARTPRPRLARGDTIIERARKVAHGVRRLLWGTRLGWLVLVNFGFFFAFSTMESTFALLMEARLGWGARETGILFTGIGVVIVLVQGVIVGRAVQGIGEKRTLIVGMLVLIVGLSSTGLGIAPWHMWVGAAGIAAGNGLVTPSLNAMVSRVSSDEEQGISLGLSSSAASLARILGPALAGIIFETIGPGIPMLTGAVIVAAATLVAALALPRRAD